MIPEDFIFPYIFSNLFAIAVLVVCILWQNVGKWVFAVIFFAAFLANLIMALTDPLQYVEGYGELAALPIYKAFIYGAFSKYTIIFISLIAIGQLTVGFLLLQSDAAVKFGLIGAIIFFLAIAPLGIGSAFPSTLIMAAAVVILLVREFRLSRETNYKVAHTERVR